MALPALTSWLDATMVLDASSVAQVDLLRQAALRFGDEDRVTAFVEAPGARAFVAVEDADDVIGWCWGHHLVRPDAPPMLYLHALEVVEGRRRHGHGRALLDAFMRAGKAAGATKMFLSTARANEPARRLYESVGGALAAQGPTLNYWFLLR